MLQPIPAQNCYVWQGAFTVALASFTDQLFRAAIRDPAPHYVAATRFNNSQVANALHRQKLDNIVPFLFRISSSPTYNNMHRKVDGVGRPTLTFHLHHGATHASLLESEFGDIQLDHVLFLFLPDSFGDLSAEPVVYCAARPDSSLVFYRSAVQDFLNTRCKRTEGVTVAEYNALVDQYEALRNAYNALDAEATQSAIIATLREQLANVCADRDAMRDAMRTAVAQLVKFVN